MFVAYDSVDLGKSREYNDDWPSQEGYDDFQDILETREKCMINIYMYQQIHTFLLHSSTMGI